MSFDSRIAANGDGEAVIANRSNVPIVAYIFEIIREPCNPIEAGRDIFAGYDAGTMRNGEAIRPFTSRTQNIGVSRCNKDGVDSPAKASLKVALFADGTKVGDERWVAILRQYRKFELLRIDGAIQAFKGIETTQTRQECLALLEKAKVSFHPMEEPQVEFSGMDDPYETAIRQLTDNQTPPLKSQVADLLAALRAWRGKIRNELDSSH